MTIDSIIQLMIAIPTMAGFLSVIFWAVMKFAVGRIMKEFKPNGGNSLRDVNDFQVKLLELYLERQTANHKENKLWMHRHQEQDEASFQEVRDRLIKIEESGNKQIARLVEATEVSLKSNNGKGQV